MAQLLLIAGKSLSDMDNRESGDLIGIFDDSHVFSEHERKIFDVVKVKGSREEVEKSIVQPEVRTATKDEKDNTWSLSEDTSLTAEKETKQVWDDGGEWKELKVEPRFVLRYDDKSLEIEENYSRYAENKDTTLIAAETSKEG